MFRSRDGLPTGASHTSDFSFAHLPGRFSAWIDGRPLQALLSIVLVALILATVKLWLDPPNFDFNWENRWWQIALNVVRGEGYVACKDIYFPFCGPANQVTAMREPLPVLLFALIALLTKESLLAAAAATVAANLAILVAIFYLTRELANTRTALLAALLWAGYLAPIRLFYSQVSGDLIAALAITCALFLLLRARRTGGWFAWVSAGVCIGLAALSRSAVIVVAIALSAGLMLRPYTSGTASWRWQRQRLRPFLLFAVSWMLVMSPWLVRNYFAFGRPVVGSTLAGYYLYRQNYMLPAENYLRFVSGGEFLPVIEETLARRTDLDGTENEAEMDQVYREEALRIISAEPFRYVALSAYRFLMLWFNWGVNAVYRKPNAVGDYIIMAQHAVLLFTGLIGMRGRFRLVWPLALSLAVFCWLYMAVMAHMPYIVPVMPILVATSAITFMRIAQHIEVFPSPMGLAQSDARG